MFVISKAVINRGYKINGVATPLFLMISGTPTNKTCYLSHLSSAVKVLVA